jgi:hypothetical protein
MKLTSIDFAPFVNFNSLIHIVNTGDTSQSPDGSSYKAPLSDIVPLIGNQYWSASTGTNSLVKANSLLLAPGQYSLAEGLENVSTGFASHVGGYKSISFGTTSFVHSTNSLAIGDRSVVLGGQGITGTSADTVYVPKLNINNTPSTDNSLTNILVRSSNGDIKTKTLGNIASFTWETKTNVGGITWNASSNTGYISNNGHPVNPSKYLLPTTASIGDIVKVNVLNGKAAFIVSPSQSFVYGTGNNIVGGSFTSPIGFNFGKYESAEATYLGDNKWILSNFQTTEDLSFNPLTSRIY